MIGLPIASQHVFSRGLDAAPIKVQHAADAAQPPRHYLLSCTGCGATFEDGGYTLDCISCRTPALLVSQYHANELRVSMEETGIYRYKSWLPVQRSLVGFSRSVTYQSKRLSALTGLKKLWIAFNGYWPERGAHCLSGTFKELEAHCVLGRLPIENENVLVVASAGNTAAAFARVCSLNGVRCLIVIPQGALAHMRFEQPIASCVRIVTVTGAGDYADAIRLAGHAAKLPGFFPEGGAKNVARRDGLGTVLLNAYETIGRLPDYYFQAIGSGTGAIAVHECARRLSVDNKSLPRLWLSQNLPFAPIYHAWKTGARDWPHLPEEDAKQQISQIQAQVLANRFPPYAIRGGLYEALVESKGEVLVVTNDQARNAAQLFEESEGIDIEPAAAVAFASLLTSIAGRRIPADATVVLNVTGGGRLRHFAEGRCMQSEADLQIDPAAIDSTRTLNEIAGLFAGTVARC
jgi:cysteate synthase